MENHTNPTAQKLLSSFMQFDKAEWHERTIAGCKPSEIRVLFCIKKGLTPDCPEMKVSEISKRLHVTSPTITQLMKGLEANGLIERSIDPSDRRAVGITLTAKGEMVTQQAAEAFAASLNELIAYLGEEQSNQLAELLAKVFRYYNEKATSTHRSHWNGDEVL
ncbi:MAG: winged helix-turn-helix transcriptional regulator [Ktedonobacteraceae bacterium]|nr:winged helix-turn-helix transcriptional regulator [Ktedonobacteraceae bacterium]